MANYNGAKNYFAKQLCDPSKFLMVTAIVGWAASAAAQVGALVINEKIPDKEKKFLIPQEIMDAAINISLFALLTSKLGKIGSNFVKKGIIVPKNLANDLKNITGKARTATIESYLQKNPMEIDKFNKTVKSVSTGFSLIGSIIGGNIATPYARNYIASIYQNTRLNKENPAIDKKHTVSQPFNGKFKNNMDLYLISTRNSSSNLKI